MTRSDRVERVEHDALEPEQVHRRRPVLEVRLPRGAHRQQGEGPPLVVLHGLFGSGTNWRTVARRLSAHHRVILADMRNHGESPHAAEMDYVAQAGDVRALLGESS